MPIFFCRRVAPPKPQPPPMLDESLSVWGSSSSSPQLGVVLCLATQALDLHSSEEMKAGTGALDLTVALTAELSIGIT